MVLVPLSPLLVALFCLGLAAVLTILALAIANVLADAPSVLGWLGQHVAAFVQSIANKLGQAFAGVDHLIGAAIHLAARYLDGLWHEIRSHAQLLAEVASGLALVAGAIHGVRVLARAIEKRWHGIEHGVRELTKAWHGIEHRVHALEKRLAHGIGNDVRSAVKDLRREVYRVEKPAIKALRDAEAATAGEVSNLYEWAKGKADLIGVGTFATAVALALSKLGLDLFKCNEAKNIYNKRGCGLWGELDDLLGLALLTVGAMEFETLVKAAQGLTEEAVADFEDVFGL